MTSKYNIGDILEGTHIPGASYHLLVEDIIYSGIYPIFYSVRNLEEDMIYEKLVKRLDQSIYYTKVA